MASNFCTNLCLCMQTPIIHCKRYAKKVDIITDALMYTTFCVEETTNNVEDWGHRVIGSLGH
jgi:hypothetical protein